ncbi:MAG: acyl-CoA dehydrogenase family protein, partial [Rhodocyclaceae bacterium]|nr:acyl-CoA dehydrogenase family protein [Rhodocyclaceae bacterium]
MSLPSLDFALGETVEMVRDSVRAFVREQIAPHAARWDREHTFPREALRGLAELGCFGIAVPDTWGC